MTAAELARLHGACFTSPRPWSEREFVDLLTLPGVFLLTEDGGFLLGRAVADEAELLTLAVLPDRRRRGIGARLVSGFLAEARTRAAGTAFLEVAADNAAAIALYAAHGFAEAGRRRGYYGAEDGRRVDALILSRMLGEGSADS